MMRIGHGYDVHRLVEGRPLMLGGIEVPHTLGLLGHSDADVVLHAICDAILGALGLGDLGHHFPDSDPQFKGVASSVLLGRVIELMRKKRYAIANLDATIIAQKPRLAQHIPAMQSAIARICECACEQINIKATTTENLGFEGRMEGISTHAVVLLTQES
jgi:2-C-methyl-D-erythritol 2,4-cyclodiphosphate synthase